MERTKKSELKKEEVKTAKAEETKKDVIPAPEEPKRLRWRKLGGGSLRIKNVILKPNQIFYAYEKDIPKEFRDVVQCLDSTELDRIEETERKEVERIMQKEELYVLEEPTPGWFDVVNNVSGKPMATHLPEAEAQKLMDSLNG